MDNLHKTSLTLDIGKYSGYTHSNIVDARILVSVEWLVECVYVVVGKRFYPIKHEYTLVLSGWSDRTFFPLLPETITMLKKCASHNRLKYSNIEDEKIDENQATTTKENELVLETRQKTVIR